LETKSWTRHCKHCTSDDGCSASRSSKDGVYRQSPHHVLQRPDLRTSNHASDARLELRVLGGVGKWVDATVGEDRDDADMVEPIRDGRTSWRGRPRSRESRVSG